MADPWFKHELNKENTPDGSSRFWKGDSDTYHLPQRLKVATASQYVQKRHPSCPVMTLWAALGFQENGVLYIVLWWCKLYRNGSLAHSALDKTASVMEVDLFKRDLPFFFIATVFTAFGIFADLARRLFGRNFVRTACSILL